MVLTTIKIRKSFEEKTNNRISHLSIHVRTTDYMIVICFDLLIMQFCFLTFYRIILFWIKYQNRRFHRQTSKIKSFDRLPEIRKIKNWKITNFARLCLKKKTILLVSSYNVLAL